MDEPPYTCETSQLMNNLDAGEMPETPAEEQTNDPLAATACSAIDACKLAVSGELMAALNGSDKTARTEDGFIRWGLVEKRIHTIIEGYWPNTETQTTPDLKP